MGTLNTEPYREAMSVYAETHGLAPYTDVPAERGFDPHAEGPLMRPGEHFLGRIQTHMTALRKNGRRVYPQVKVTEILDQPTRVALIPPRPLWPVTFKEICLHDVKNRARSMYTEDSHRWQAVDRFDDWLLLDAPMPQLVTGDCSSTYTGWVKASLQMMLGHAPPVDVVNNLNWQAGNTDSIERVMQRVETPMVGDAALYHGHVAGVYTLGRVPIVCNMGRPGEPVFKPYNRRTDFIGFYRIKSTT